MSSSDIPKIVESERIPKKEEIPMIQLILNRLPFFDIYVSKNEFKILANS